MKTNLLILSFLLCIGAKNYAQNVNIPDANFKAALVGNTVINTNGDSEIQVSEASAYADTINVSNLGISDLTGIEAFTQLNSLYCGANQLNFLNITNNLNLKTLSCVLNQLTILDISNNINLENVFCGDNVLTSLDVSNNLNLKTLNCNTNQLTNLDVTNNVNLEKLYCGFNQLTNLDITNNVNLGQLYCGFNQLTNLDVTNNVNLGELYCHENQLNELDISYNTILKVFNCQNNINLYCIQVADTNDANYQLTTENWEIDLNMYFSLDCNYTSTAENLASSLSILPNPASNYLYISYEGEKKLSFAISDIWGKTLAAWEAHSAGAFYEKEVPIANFPVGIYFLSVQAGDKKVVKKFVKE